MHLLIINSYFLGYFTELKFRRTFLSQGNFVNIGSFFAVNPIIQDLVFLTLYVVWELFDVIYVLSDITHAVSARDYTISGVAHTVSEHTHEISDVTHTVSECTRVISDDTHTVSECTRVISDDTHTISERTHEISDVAHLISDVAHVITSIASIVSEKPTLFNKNPLMTWACHQGITGCVAF